MPEALPIRTDVSADELRVLARREKKGRVVARMLAIAHALDGIGRAEAARLAGMDRQALRDTVVRYNVEGISGLYDRPPSGRPRWLTTDEEEKASLSCIVRRLGLSRQKTRPRHPKSDATAQEDFKKKGSTPS